MGARSKQTANVNEYFDFKKDLELPLTSHQQDYPAYELDQIKQSNNLDPKVMRAEIPEKFKLALQAEREGLVNHLATTKLKTDCKTPL